MFLSQFFEKRMAGKIAQQERKQEERYRMTSRSKQESMNQLNRSATLAELGFGFNLPTLIGIMENMVYGFALASIPLGILYYHLVSTPYYRDATILKVPGVLSTYEGQRIKDEVQNINPRFQNKFDNNTAIASLQDLGSEIQPILNELITSKLYPRLSKHFNISSDRLHMQIKDMYIVKRVEGQTAEQEEHAFRNYRSDFTYHVNLNEQGGGDLKFELQRQGINSSFGEVVVWPSRIHNTLSSFENSSQSQYYIVGFAGYQTGLLSTPYGQFMSCSTLVSDNTLVNSTPATCISDLEDDVCEAVQTTTQIFEKECTFIFKLFYTKAVRKFSLHLQEDFWYFYAFNYAIAASLNFGIIFLGVRAFAYTK